LNSFNEGLSNEEARNIFSEINLNPTNELVQLYEWRNGLKYTSAPSGKLYFGVSGIFYPVKTSVDIYQRSLEFLKYFFPVFSDDSFLINLNKESENFGKVFIYSPALLINEPQGCYDSIDSMVETYLTCFQQKIFYYDADGFFQENYDQSNLVSRSLNPNSEYWT